MQLLAKFKKILYMGFRATLNFRKIKVALNPMYRIFLNFAKSCILSCSSKVDNIKKFQNSESPSNSTAPRFKYHLMFADRL